MTTLPIYPDDTDAETPTAEVPEETPAPEVDMEQHIALHAQHEEAVRQAHESLAQRTKNAYEIFTADLDRAYRIWEDGSKLIREGLSLFQTGGTINVGHSQDPASAV